MKAAKKFQDHYRRQFAALGHPLTSRDALPEAQIGQREKRLGMRLPKALRDYFLVAGRERSFNQAFNRLCAPDDWSLDSGKLVFMEETQGALLWGVSATSELTIDPAVYQGVIIDGEVREWHPEHERCSVFLSVILHWQATFGGAMKCCDSAPAPVELVTILDRDWSLIGEVNGMRAYGEAGKAVCFLRWQTPFRKELWRVFAGARTKTELDAIARELGLSWE